MFDFIIWVLLPLVIVGVIINRVLSSSLSILYQGFPKALAAGFRECQYILTRGEKTGGESSYFYDIDLSITDPHLIETIANWYVNKIKQINKEFGQITKLAFIEKDSGPVGAVLLASLIIKRTGVPGIVVRLRRRLSGNSLKGAKDLKEDDRIVIISDVATSGGGILKAREKLSAKGAKVPAALVLVNRGGKEELEKMGIKIFYILNAPEDLKKEPMMRFMKDEMDKVI